VQEEAVPTTELTKASPSEKPDVIAIEDGSNHPEEEPLKLSKRHTWLEVLHASSQPRTLLAEAAYKAA
jgi:hypothetical protein